MGAGGDAQTCDPVDLESGVRNTRLSSMWMVMKLALPGTLLLAFGIAATVASNHLFSDATEVDGSGVRRLESVDTSQGLNSHEAAGVVGLHFGMQFFILFLIICCQFFAYKRSRGEPHEYKDDGSAPLLALSGDAGGDPFGQQLTLQQQWKVKELCGCEARNRYMSSDQRFYIDERSDCIQRTLASTNRELTLFGHAGDGGDAPINLRMYKPYHLQGCCCCRPSLQIDRVNGNSFTNVGKIEDPFKCCTMDQQIFDARGGQKFTVAGAVCQCGMCCPFCADVNFAISDASGNEVGKITKPAVTCGEACTKTNRFVVDFPKQCSMEEKQLLVGAAMLLDLQYFEQNKNDN